MNYRKITAEHGATMVLTLQDQNSELRKVIGEKNMIIKRLQNDMQATKLYGTSNSVEKKKCVIPPIDYEFESTTREINLTIPYFHTDTTDCESRQTTKSKSFVEIYSKEKYRNRSKSSEPSVLVKLL